MSDRDQPRQGRCPRWMRVLLGLSLALNLLVAGLAAGAALRYGRAGEMHQPPRSLAGAMIRELPQQDRRALRALARDDLARDGNGGYRARRRAEASAVADALRAVPFDTAILRSLLDDQNRRRAAIRDELREAWLARVAAMGDTERAAYADRVEQAMRRGGPRGRHRGGGGD
ncbi:MAG: periplasmic heavy metal sensor [Jhaorihella sp.]